MDDTIANLFALAFIVSFIAFWVFIFMSFEKRNLEELREHVLEFLVEGELNRLTYQNLSLPTLDERIENYYTKEEITPELLDYIENNFMRIMSEKLEKTEESKRPRSRTSYRDSQMTMQEIEQIVISHLDIIKEEFNQNTKQATTGGQ